VESIYSRYKPEAYSADFLEASVLQET